MSKVRRKIVLRNRVPVLSKVLSSVRVRPTRVVWVSDNLHVIIQFSSNFPNQTNPEFLFIFCIKRTLCKQISETSDQISVYRISRSYNENVNGNVNLSINQSINQLFYSAPKSW